MFDNTPVHWDSHHIRMYLYITTVYNVILCILLTRVRKTSKRPLMLMHPYNLMEVDYLK